jgi:hypothetical protein
MLLMIVICGSSWAEDEPWVTGSWETTVNSRYLAFPGMPIHDEPTVENQLTLNFNSGLYAILWGLVPFNQTEGFKGEVDLYAGYDHLFFDDRLKLGLEFDYFALNDPFEKGKDDQWAIVFKASLPKTPLVTPYLWVKKYGEFSDASPEGGMFYFVGLTRHQPLWFKLPGSTENQALDLEARIAWADGAMWTEPGLVFSRFMVSTEIKLTEAWSMAPSFVYQHIDESQDDGPWKSGGRGVGRLTFKWSF